MTKRNCISLLALLAASVPATAADRPRQPTGKWVVNYADSQCVASRMYGSAPQELWLVIKTPPLGTVVQLAVVRSGRGSEAEQVDATVEIDQRPPLRTSLLRFTPKGIKQRTNLINMKISDFAAVRAAKTISIRASGLNERFALSAMAPLLKAMDECAVDLRKVWNVSDIEGVQSKLKARATGNLVSYFRSEDYPAAALNRRQIGLVKFVLLINEAGAIADCTVIETSGVASLDAQTCGVLTERAKFKPAVGADGKPAKDGHIGRVRWDMP